MVRISKEIYQTSYQVCAISVVNTTRHISTYTNAFFVFNPIACLFFISVKLGVKLP